MMRPATGLLFALVPILGCVPEDEATITAEEQEILGSPLGGDATNTRAGVVQIEIPGDPQVRTGLLIDVDLVLTSARWFTAHTVATQLRVRHGTVLRGGVVRSGSALTINPFLPVAIIQTQGAFSGVPAVTFDTRTAAQLVGSTLNCFAYNNANDFRRAEQPLIRGDGGNEVIGSSTIHAMQDRDAGAPCFDSVTERWSAFAISASGSEGRLTAASAIRFFVDGMRRVARLRRQGQGEGYQMQTTAPGGAAMCLDVPWGYPYNYTALNQFPCNAGRNQRWYIDYSTPEGPSFVNAIAGTCIEVPGSSTTIGQALQMHGCHDGVNQSWIDNGGLRLSPRSAPVLSIWPPRRTLCMSVRGGASTSSRVIEQASCIVAAHQDWYFQP